MHKYIIAMICVSALVLTNCGTADESTPAKAVSIISPGMNTVGKQMPSDAAPLDQQIFRYLIVEPTTLDVNIDIYQAQSGITIFESLTGLNIDLELTPAAAERWEVSEDGTRWTFYLRKNAKWSDGQPVTAHDFEYTYIRGLDPTNASAYASFLYPIKGARAFNLGETKDLSSVGVKAIDDYTLIIETEGPCPYLPHLASYAVTGAVPRWAIEKHGKQWTEPQHIVTNSTFTLGKWQKGSSFEFILNPYYNGPKKAYLERIVGLFVGAERSGGYLAYENNEIDYQGVAARDVASLRGNPELKEELHIYGDYVSWFLIFDTQNPPFNDLRVRQAISHAIDRDVLCDVVLQGTASPAYAMLPPGYPGDAEHTLDHIQRFDPVMARQRFAEAGYPGGRGFPRKELVINSAGMKHTVEAIQQMLKDYLNIDIAVKVMEPTTYGVALYQWKLPMSLNRFGRDYFDPSNMLSMVWHSKPKPYGRQSWKNETFDRLIDQADQEMDPEKRASLYADAQRILSEDVGGVFVFHQKDVSLRKPWVKGIPQSKRGEYPFLLGYQGSDIYIGDNVRR